MIKQPKYKICRRLGSGIFEKCQTQKFVLSESKKSVSKKRGRRKQLSDYGAQLLEKQKVKLSYGLKEKNLVRYVKEALKKKSDNVYNSLFESLESRLDNVVYRLGLAETRAKARQMVSHGHIVVNGRKVNIPSFSVSVGDEVGIRKQSISKKLFSDLEKKLKETKIFNWLSFDIKNYTGKITGIPKTTSGELFDLRAVFEFYSR